MAQFARCINTLRLADVLATPTQDSSGKRTVLIDGDAADQVTLSNLLADGASGQGQWQASGTTQFNGHDCNVFRYSGDATLQVLIDQHIATANVHLQ